MPVFNGAKFLGESILSVLNQNYANFELLVLNDGSQDNSLEIAKSFSSIDSRVKVFDTQNEGISSKRNLGIFLASGDYIAWLDADDIAFPSRVEVQVNFLLENKLIDMVGGGCVLIDELGVEISTNIYERISHEAILSQLCIDNAFINSTVMIRSEVAKKYKFNKRFDGCEDYEFYSRLALTHTCQNLPLCLVQYRVHSSSISIIKKNRIRNNANHIAIRQLMNYIDFNIEIHTIKSIVDVVKYNRIISIKKNFNIFLILIKIYCNRQVKFLLKSNFLRMQLIYFLFLKLLISQFKTLGKNLRDQSLQLLMGNNNVV